MVVESKQDSFDNGMHALQFLDEPNVNSVAESISFFEDSVLPEIVDSELRNWAQRIAERHHEVTSEIEHHSLKKEIVEHNWALSGRSTQLETFIHGFCF